MAILRKYPVKKPSSAPATGRLFYRHLMNKVGIPARANHSIWHAGEEAKLKSPSEFAFRGAIPKGGTLELKKLSGRDGPERKKGHFCILSPVRRMQFLFQIYHIQQEKNLRYPQMQEMKTKFTTPISFLTMN